MLVHNRYSVNINSFIKETVEAVPVILCIVMVFLCSGICVSTPSLTEVNCLYPGLEVSSLGWNFPFGVSYTMFMSRTISHSCGWCSWVQIWHSYAIIFLDCAMPDSFLGMLCDIPEKALNLESRGWFHGGVNLLVPLSLHQNPMFLGI